MKILIVSQYYYPEQFQINEIAPELVRRGHDVTVLTGLPNYPKGEIFEGYRNGEHMDDVVDGVRIIRVRNHPRKKGPLHLMWNYVSYAMRAGRVANRLDDDFDVIFSYELSPITSIYPAIVYARKHHVPHMAYCLDIWPESAKAHMGMPGVYSVVEAISRAMYQACDHIAVTSKPFIDYLHKQNGIPTEKMSYLPQHADTAMLEMDLANAQSDTVHFMYAGNLGAGQWVHVILQATASLSDRHDYMVDIVGDGSQRGQLEAMAKEYGIIDRVVFHGNQPRSKMPEYYKKADVLLLTLRGNNAVGDTMPGKLQMYMTTGKPVIGAVNGAAEQVINESRCGRCVAAGDAEGMGRLMGDYLDHPEVYENCGRAGRNYFMQHFTLQHFMDQLEEQLNRMVNHV